MNFDHFIHQIEDLIRTGKRDLAGRQLKEIKIGSIPRAHINSLANLARRTGQLNLAWQMIAPIIRPKFPLAKPASDAEKATYSIILLGLGAIPESVDLLESADSKCAEVNLAFAFAHISRWDYLAAIPKLRSYLRADGLTLYEKMVAQVNLAASYVATGNSKNAAPLLQEILKTTCENGWHLLNRNALEISAQLSIQLRQWDQADKYLTQAIHEGEGQFNLDSFFIMKWQAIIFLLRDGPSPKALRELARVRALAETNKHWETIRDCDYYQAIATQDLSLALHLYFGTPFASYRKRLLERAKNWLVIPEEYKWEISKQASKRVFRLGQGEELNGKATLKTGTALYRTLVALSSDFYRPFSAGSLYSLVFPKEYFNPSSSPRRISFLIQRLRQWFKETKIPLVVLSEKDGFKLQATAPFTFILERPSQLSSSKTTEPAQYLMLIKKLKILSQGRALKTSEISAGTNLSVRSIRYFLKWAMEKNKIQKLGNGRESRYKIR